MKISGCSVLALTSCVLLACHAAARAEGGFAAGVFLGPAFTIALDADGNRIESRQDPAALAYDEPMHIATLPDGSYVVGTSKTLTRVLPEGKVDATFGYGLAGVAGRCVMFDRCNGVYGPLAVGADGSIFVSMVASTSWEPSGPGVFGVVKLKANGKRDARFGVDGIALLRKAAGMDDIHPVGLVLQQGGGLLVVGSTLEYSTWRYHASAARFLADGRHDRSFGVEGRKLLDFGDDARPSFAADRVGGFYLAGAERGVPGPWMSTWPRPQQVVRFDSDAVRDPLFQVFERPENVFMNGEFVTLPRLRIAVDPAGRLLVLTFAPGGFVDLGFQLVAPRMIRLDGAGTRDESFSIEAGVPNHGGYVMAFDEAHRMLLSFSAGAPLFSRFGDAVTRTSADGVPDPTFGAWGSRLLGTDVAVRALHAISPGALLVAGFVSPAGAPASDRGGQHLRPVLMRISEGEPHRVWVDEYRQVERPYYFYTSIPAEIEWLSRHRDTWAVTSSSFQAWSGPGAGRIPVCRFMSGAAQLPQVAHFFTTDAALCATIRPSNDVWIYEGTPFYIVAAKPDGSCPETLVPLRAARNGITGIPNVRMYRADHVRWGDPWWYVPAGWTAEGVVGVIGCVPH